jgi:hypothetical protein
MTLRHEVYRGPLDLPASRFVCPCGAAFYPAVTITLDSRERGTPSPYNAPSALPGVPYRPYGPLLAFVEAHRGCVGRAEVRTVERGLLVVDRRGMR